MIDPTCIIHEVAAQAFCDAFRRCVGLGSGTVRLNDLSEAVAIDVRTLKAWRDGETVAQFHKVLRLCAYCGPAFASEILRPAGLGGVEEIYSVAIDAPATAANLVKTAHDLLERGVFCHHDKVACGPLLLALSRDLESQGRWGISMDKRERNTGVKSLMDTRRFA